MSERASAWLGVLVAAVVAFYVWARLLQAAFIWPWPLLWAGLFVAWTIIAPILLWRLIKRVRAVTSASRRP